MSSAPREPASRMVRVAGVSAMEFSGTLDDDDEYDGDLFDGEEIVRDSKTTSKDFHKTFNFHDQAQSMSKEIPFVGSGIGGEKITEEDLVDTSVDPAHGKRIILHEKDLLETFVKGGGKGGQKINKTSNCVLLVHKPTGTRVKCQAFRELQANRQRARTILKDRLEEILLGPQSRRQIQAAKIRRRKSRNGRRRKAKLRAKEEAGNNDNSSDELTSST
jgi:hypothetical protein